MSDATQKPAARISMRKSSGAGPDPADQVAKPRQVILAVGALALSAVAAVVAAIALRGQRAWLVNDQIAANRETVKKAVTTAVDQARKDGKPIQEASASASAKATKTLPDPQHHASQVMSSQLIGALLIVAVLAFLSYGVYRGRHWARWGVTGFWILATFTGTTAGLFTVLNVGSSIPAAYKIPAFIAGVSLIVAVVLVNMRPSTAYFALSRPVAAGGAQRRGLFGPRPAGGAGARPQRDGGSILTSNAAMRGEKYVERQRAKKRANAEAVAHGAELARTRAKASKSRRGGDR